MPGIFGAIAVRASNSPELVAARMLEILRHKAWYGSVLHCRKSQAIGAVSTNPAFKPEDRLSESPQATLLVEGTAFTLDGVPVPDDTPGLARLLLDRYLADGDSFIDRIGGHFNLCLLDKRDGRLQICNDKLGFAHLYWYHDDEIFVFGPELKAFLAWQGLDRRVDRNAAAAFLSVERPYGTTSLFQDVTMLGPAQRLVWDGRQAKVTRRWRAEPRPQHDRKRDDLLDEAESLYARSVAKRLPPSHHGRTVVLLSGGLDSRLLLWQVKDRDDLDICTHGQPDCSEYLIAQKVVKALGLSRRHRLLEIDPHWAGQYARLAVWLNDGQLNMRNATAYGIYEHADPGPYPLLNGIIGPFLAVSSGRICSEDDICTIEDEAVLRQRALAASEVPANQKRLTRILRPEIAAEFGERLAEQAWLAFREWRHAPLFGDQKLLHMHFHHGRRGQALSDILRFQFHSVLPLVDEDLFDFWLRIPLRDKFEDQIYLDLYRQRMTVLAKIPWNRTGHDLFASPAAIEQTAARRRRAVQWNLRLRRLTRGRLHLRDRTTYDDRPAWWRRSKILQEEVFGVLARVDATGCDWFDQAAVDRLRSLFTQGHDWPVYQLAQVYTMLVWHDLFIRNAAPGQPLIPREAETAPDGSEPRASG